MKKLYILIIILYFWSSVRSQDYTLNGINLIIDRPNISEKVSDYKAYKIDLSGIKYENELNLNFNLGKDYVWKLHLVKNNLRSEGYESYLQTETGLKSNTEIVRTYKGYLNSDEENKIRLSLYENYVEGFVIVDNKKYYLMPLVRITGLKNDTNIVILCESDDLKEKISLENDAIILQAMNSLELKSIDYDNPVRIARIAVEGDYEYYQNHSSDPSSYIEGIINMAEDVYQSTFNIIFKIVFNNVYATSSDPFTEAFNYANRSNFLDELETHFTTDHSGIYSDVVFLFTGKPVDDISGVAEQPGTYGAVGDFVGNYKTFAHELGHNFNGRHEDASNCGTADASVMCQGIKKDPLYFTATNISRISSNISSRLITYSYFSDDELCGNETFSISNVPYGFSITWPKSANLAFDGASTETPVTIKPYSASSFGLGWVEPTLSRGSGTNTVKFPKDNFWVGHPSTPTDITNSYNYPENTLALDELNQLIAMPQNDPHTTNFEWDYGGWYHFEVGDQDFVSYVSVPSYFVYKDVKLRAQNTCGASDWYTERFYPGGGYFMLFTPNPTAGETTLSIESNAVDNLDENEEWELEVYSESQLLKEKKTKLKGKSTKIQTAGWQEGVYAVRVKYKDEVLTGKLVVKK